MIETIKISIISSFLQTTITYPLEYMKIQKQLGNPLFSKNMYRGSLISFHTTALRHSVRWTIYPFISKYTDNSAIKGLCVGLGETIIWAPTETIRTNMINNNINISKSVKDSYKNGFYRGAISTLNKSLTKQATRFVIYENLRSYTYLAGMIAGFFSVMISHPFDVIKTKMEVDNHRNKMIDVMKNQYKTLGMRGLYMGCSIRLLTGTITSGISFGVFEIYRRPL